MSVYSADTVPLVVYDFPSKFSLRHDAQTGRFNNAEYCFEPTVVENGILWRDIVITTGASCPYRKIATHLHHDSWERMFYITEDCVLLADAQRCVT